MSYLHTPRINFAGQFFTNPATINNVLANYDPANPIQPVWNPDGVAIWRFQDVTVQTVVNDAGDLLQSGQAGGIVGAAVESVPDPKNAKLVDLDPDQQLISQVFGFKLKLSVTDGDGNEVGFVGRLDTLALTDIWFGRPGGVSGNFQTLMPEVQWIGDVDQAPLLKQLKELGEAGLSVKWMTWGYQFPPTFLGQVAGSIGPAKSGEPTRFIAGRRLHQAPPSKDFGQPPFWQAPWCVDANRSRAVFDLSNSVPLNQAGSLNAVILTASGPVDLDTPLTYSMQQLQAVGGIVEIPLTDQQKTLLDSNPLVVFDGQAAALREDLQGRWANFDQQWLRLEPGESKTVKLFARRFNDPLPQETIDFAPTRPRQPSAGLTFPASVQTGADGQADVAFTGNVPQPLPPSREFIDSQTYFVGGPWQQWGDAIQAAGGGAISVLVFNEFAPPANPTWTNAVQPIFDEYARLYPGMKAILDLADLSVVRANSGRFEGVLDPALPITDPSYMPVTRDLAPAKRETVFNWLKAGAPD